MTKAVLGVIGGSGIYDLPGLERVRQRKIKSPWGEPSAALRVGEIAGTAIVFLARVLAKAWVKKALLAAAGVMILTVVFAVKPVADIELNSPQETVTFDQLLNPGKAPQNWLIYGGSFTSQRHSQLTQITPANAKDLELKWVFQSRSLGGAVSGGFPIPSGGVLL